MLTRIEQRYAIPVVPHPVKEDDTNPLPTADAPVSDN
jgi:hypothetical protein